MGKSIGLFLAKVIVSVVPLLFLLLIQGSATEVDIQCLKALKRNLIDPNDYLSTWKFENLSEGTICNFVGVDCWHPNENRVLNIKLPGMGFEGNFPMGFNYCTTMTGLDLSDNKFTGNIPAKLPKWIQYLTSLDLSQNNFVGPIPREVANLTYLNILHLQSNQLTGQIPWELTRLERLKDFNVANNRLSGQIPTFSHKFEAANFNNNSDLCGFPLRNCNESLPAKKTSPVIPTAASVTGVSVVFLIGYSVWWFFIRSEPKEIVFTDESKWAERIKGRSSKVSMFEKHVSKISLADLMVATNEFSTENIIGTGRTGTMYKATLPDGSLLAIKRLQPSAQTDKQFKSEMITLGQLRHQNLVPLLGYCVSKGEKLLVYRHMPNGTLYEKLHIVESDGTDGNIIDWPKRLKIAIGAARGLAWLHHSCNPRIIHRNVSSKCILLNEDYEPRITDFGLARLMNPVDTHLSTFVNGDFGDLGYVAPEYMRTLVATLKGDVFSFGVVLLELVTGQKPVEVENVQESFKGNLVDWISNLSKHGNVQEAIDEALIGRGYDDELLQVLKVACNCVLSPHKERPSMYEVYHLLRAIGENYNFSDQNDDIPFVSDTAERDYSNELIVAIDPK